MQNAAAWPANHELNILEMLNPDRYLYGMIGIINRYRYGTDSRSRNLFPNTVPEQALGVKFVLYQ